MNKVSIIIPVYNTSKYIKKCIESLLNQTYKNIEIIIINDGSTDNSEEIILSYKDNRIKYIAKENEGIGKTRNLGIDLATGDYLMFIDSDDYIKEDCIEKFIRKCISSKCDVVVSDYYEDKDKLKEIKLPSFNDNNLRGNPNILNMINLGPCNKIYSKELFKKKENRFVENLKYEDAPFVCKLLCDASKIGKIDECLSYYVIHNNSQTTVRDQKIFDIIEIINIIIKDLSKYDYLKKELTNLCVKILTNYTIQTRCIKDKNIRNQFIDKAFNLLNNLDKNWKKCSFLKTVGLSKKIIKSNKKITKIYCNIYSVVKG